MRSSTSSSESGQQWPDTYWQRPIPTAHWQGVSLLTVLLLLGAFLAWETHWRMQGYEPSMEENPDLWAFTRARVGHNPGDVVIIGSSRAQFDLDLEMWEQEWGERPVMLARAGTGPVPFLRDLADDPQFRGTVICGVTEGLFFAPPFIPPVQDAEKMLKYSRNWSLSQKAGFFLSIPVESAFASINKEDLSLRSLLRLRVLPLSNREGAYVAPRMPPYFARLDLEHRQHMWSRAEHDPALQQLIQQTWMPLFQMGPPFAGEGLDALIAGVVADVEKIRARGGQVLFIRPPSTGDLRELERRSWPREAYWDRLLRETGAPGIHFEDYPELSGFDCPEWSHLTRSDAVIYTWRLVPIARELLAAP